jgi:hypothetical protein
VRARVFSWQSTCRPDWVHEIRGPVHAPRAELPLSGVTAETAMHGLFSGVRRCPQPFCGTILT